MREYRYDKLNGTQFVGSEVPKVGQLKADVYSGLNGVLVEVKLEFLHRA